MSASFHAIFLLGVMAFDAYLLALVLRQFLRPQSDVTSPPSFAGSKATKISGSLFAPCCAILLMGVIENLVIRWNARNQAEWILPLIGGVLAPFAFSNVVGVKKVSWGLAIASLCLLISLGYSTDSDEITGAPEATLSLSREIAKQSIRRAEQAILAAYDDPAKVWPAGVVGDLFPDAKVQGTVTRKTVEREWHTWLTHLYRVRSFEEPLQFPGGKLEGDFLLVGQDNLQR